MKTTDKYIGLDVHKDTTVAAIAEGGREGECRVYGTISSDLHALEKLLRKLGGEHGTYRQRIAEVFASHPDHDLFGSLPGTGSKLAPRLLGEIGDNRASFGSAEALQCRAGTAPVTVQSGMYCRQHLRYACNDILRTTVHLLRLMELLRLRVHHVDIERQRLQVYGGKGDKDRVTVLPESLLPALREHIARLKPRWAADQAESLAGVWLPEGLARKYPKAGISWEWQWLFPAKAPSIDPVTKIRRRHHLSNTLWVRSPLDRVQLRHADSKTPMHYVYVLQSGSDDGLYIGYSANLRRRLTEHRAGLSFATSYRGPWILIYYEAYIEEVDARGREEFLKSGAGRKHLGKQCRHYFTKHPARRV